MLIIIFLVIALVVFIFGSCMVDQSSCWAPVFVVPAIIFGIALVICGVTILTEHTNIDAELEKAHLLRASALILDAQQDEYARARLVVDIVRFNQNLADHKSKNQSIWLDWFHSDVWNSVPPIPLQSQRK